MNVCTDSEKQLEIRPMRPEDLPDVCAIEKENFSVPWSAGGFSDALSLPTSCYLTAVFQDKVVGYCGFYRSFEEANIVNVSVKKNVQRQGVGSCMLRELIRRGVNAGVRSFILEVRVSNTAAIALYQSLGFIESGLRRKFYTDPVEDAFVYIKKC